MVSARACVCERVSARARVQKPPAQTPPCALQLGAATEAPVHGEGQMGFYPRFRVGQTGARDAVQASQQSHWAEGQGPTGPGS